MDTAPRKQKRTQTRPVRVSPGLGALLSTYRVKSLQWDDFFFLFVPGSLMVIAPLAYGLWRAYYGYTQFGPAAAENWARPWFTLAAILLVPLVLLAVYRAYMATRSVSVHTHGLRIRLSPFQNSLLSWEEIAGVSSVAVDERFLGLPLRVRHAAVLFPEEGKPLPLNSRLENLSELVLKIKNEIYPRLTPLLAKRLEAGDWLQFGKIAIHNRGLRFGRSKLTWNQVKAVRVRSGFLVIESTSGERLRLAVSHIPNIEILVDLLDSGITS